MRSPALPDAVRKEVVLRFHPGDVLRYNGDKIFEHCNQYRWNIRLYPILVWYVRKRHNHFLLLSTGLRIGED